MQPQNHMVLWICNSHTKKCFSSSRDGSRGVGWAAPGSLCYREVTLVAWGGL